MTGVVASRPYGIVGARIGMMALAAVSAAAVHRFRDPGVLCPLRYMTGIPCPFCGGTTVFIDLGSGQPIRALLASPLVFLGAIVFAVAPLGLSAQWQALLPRARAWILGIALTASGIWQLARFGILF
jgi:hypothetical protein